MINQCQICYPRPCHQQHQIQVQQPIVTPFIPNPGPASDYAFLKHYNPTKLDLNSIPLKELEAHITNRKMVDIQARIKELTAELQRLQADLAHIEAK